MIKLPILCYAINTLFAGEVTYAGHYSYFETSKRGKVSIVDYTVSDKRDKAQAYVKSHAAELLDKMKFSGVAGSSLDES